MLEIAKLIPTHNTLRDPKSVRTFSDWVEDGRIFRVCNKFKPITLVKFNFDHGPDNRLYIHDGHRRISGAYIAGVTHLQENEYVVIGPHPYDYWYKPSPANDWFTPFDPRIECRLPDFFKYKDEMRHTYKCRKDALYLVNNEIIARRQEYLEERIATNVAEMVEASFP